MNEIIKKFVEIADKNNYNCKAQSKMIIFSTQNDKK